MVALATSITTLVSNIVFYYDNCRLKNTRDKNIYNFACLIEFPF